jgi:hypothetical protein
MRHQKVSSGGSGGSEMMNLLELGGVITRELDPETFFHPNK